MEEDNVDACCDDDGGRAAAAPILVGMDTLCPRLNVNVSYT